MRQQYRAISRDLFFSLQCTCPHRTLENSSHEVKLTGYSDDYFFDRVNEKPQEGQCKCGRKFRVQWFRDGIEAEWIDGNS